MADGIKIINILKDDEFGEVFDEFKQTEAGEVILIFPRNSRIAKEESHFVALAGAAQDTAKTVTVMTADEAVKQYSQKYGFKFLASPGKSWSNNDLDDDIVKDTAEEQTDNNSDLETEADDEETDSREEENYLQDEQNDEEKEDNVEENFEDGSNDEENADLTMARTGRKKVAKIHTADLPSTKRTLRERTGKKMDNLESIWFRGGREDPPSRVWSQKLFRRPKISFKTNLFLLAGVVIFLGLIFYFFLGSAQVVFKPQKQKFDFEITISASSDLAAIDASSSKIPGQLLTYKEEVSKDFQATGQKEVAQKARGEVTVFNNYNSEPQIFVATTRFESPSGLIFRTPRPILIPGAKLAGGKLVPRSITIEVLADKPGPEYNIGPGRFTVPGLKGTAKFDGFYAESTESFTGGITGLSKVVTENDFNKAKEQVSQESLDKVAAALKTKAGSLKIIEPLESRVVSLKSTAEAEQASNGFAMKATAEAKTIGFSEKDVLELLRLSISKDQEMILLRDSLRLAYKNIKTDFELHTITFTATVQVEAAVKIDQEKIVGKMLGMKQAKVKDYLLGIKEIESARVTLSPFWVKVVPKERKNIKVQVLY